MGEACYSQLCKLLYPRKNSRESRDDHGRGTIKKMWKSMAGIKD